MPGKRARRLLKAQRRHERPQAVTPKKSRTSQEEAEPQENQDPLPCLQGLVHDGHLFLHDPQTGDVFDSIRDEEDQLINVGSFRDSTINFSSYRWKEKHLIETKPILAFDVSDEADHCETSIKAYMHLEPFLTKLSELLEYKSKGDLKIWDPYFCTGRMKVKLLQLGFPNVHNVNEDFYAIAESGIFPVHDILLTNPPYSANHIQRLIEFCGTTSKIKALLVPSYVVQKEFFAQSLLKKSGSVIFVAPRHRYTYHNPGIYGGKRGRTAPFKSIWIISIPDKTIRKQSIKHLRKITGKFGWDLYETTEDIPNELVND